MPGLGIRHSVGCYPRVQTGTFETRRHVYLPICWSLVGRGHSSPEFLMCYRHCLKGITAPLKRKKKRKKKEKEKNQKTGSPPRRIEPPAEMGQNQERVPSPGPGRHCSDTFLTWVAAGGQADGSEEPPVGSVFVGIRRGSGRKEREEGGGGKKEDERESTFMPITGTNS